MQIISPVVHAESPAHAPLNPFQSIPEGENTCEDMVPALAVDGPGAVGQMAPIAGIDTAAATEQQDTLWFLRRVWPSTGFYVIARLVNKKWRHKVCNSIEEATAYALAFDAQELPTYFACGTYKERSVDTTRPDGKTWHRIRVQENVQSLKSFWCDLDVDPSDPKKHESQTAAVEALAEFCNGTGLPAPLCASSGGGVHAYWTLTLEVPPHVWQRTAETLKALCVARGFKIDPACTADSARVLRPIGTWNRKNPNNPRPVELIADSKPVDYATFDALVRAALKARGVKPPEAVRPRERFKVIQGGLNAEFMVPESYPPAHAHKIADQCAQIRAFRAGAHQSEPVWHASLVLLRHTVEYETIAHEWSALDPRYRQEETAGKLARLKEDAIGPTTCTRFASLNPTDCAGCPHSGRITSPIALGLVSRVSDDNTCSATNNAPPATVPSAPVAPSARGAAEVRHGLGGTTSTIQPPVVVNFTDPVPTAQAIIQSQYTAGTHRTLHSWQGQFYVWTGSHYAVLPIEDVREMLYRVGSESSRSVRRQQVDNTLDALRAYANLSNTIASPSWVAAEKNDPQPRSLIPMMNGILNIEAGTLLPKTPRLFSSYSLPFDYNPEAPGPAHWIEFLNQLWGCDTESIELVQEWFGYCLTQRTEQQKALLFVGPRRGGKGTIGRVLTALLGKENVVSPRLASFGKEFGLESLIGKQLALVSDARLGPRADLDAVAENILRVTGEDQISIPRKFLSDFTATLPTRIMVFTNEPPRFTDGSGALPSRFIVLQSDVSFLGREDHTLTQRLLEELPGIFNWSLRGLCRLRERGYFRQPAAAKELVEQIEQLAAPVKAFLAEKCETSDPAAEVPITELFNAWRVWCGLNGREHPGTQQSFGRDIHSALPQVKTVQHRVGVERVRCYIGVRLKK